MGKTLIQCSMFSHLEKKIYSAEEASEIALKCQREGAVMVHAHMYKLGSTEEFMRMVEMIEMAGGPLINLSVSDFEIYSSWKGRKSQLIKSAAMHGGDCKVFEQHISQPYENVIRELEQYFNADIIPEISIFNREGAVNCAKLNQMYPKMFYTGIYLNYPGELEATEANILWLNDVLKDCRFNSFGIYNNKNDDIVKYIIKHGGQIRCGMEDSIYCGSRNASDSIEIIRHMASLVKACGYQVGDSI